MASNNLTTRLFKELRRSPKKSAVLALMLLVALWFWAPLAWKWLAPQASDAAISTAPALAEAGAATSTADNSTTRTSPGLSWRELVKLFDSDPLHGTARVDKTLADPFAKSADDVADTAASDEGEQPAPTAVIAETQLTPEALGLTLTSTITGGRRTVATINGKSCRVGDVLVVPGAYGEFEFTIIRIAPSEVTLVAGGKTYSLVQQRPDSTMQLSQAGTAGGGSLPSAGQRVVIGPRLGE